MLFLDAAHHGPPGAVDLRVGGQVEKPLRHLRLQLYFTPSGWAKVELGLARGRKAHDKRALIKERDWQREKQRIMRHAGR